MKKNKKIIITLLIVLCFLVVTQTTYARTNPVGSWDPTGNMAEVITKLKDLGTIGVSSTLGVFGTLTTALALLLLLLMWGILGTAGIEAPGIFPPMPDTIVFNKIAILDPNYFTAETGSIAGPIKAIVLNVFNSFQVMGITLLIVTAMVIGIKYALSVIASEKAQFKDALSKWILGIVILFMIRYFLFGVFLLNEKVVEAASVIVDNVEFKVSAFNAVPFYGNTLANIAKEVAPGLAEALELTIHGYIGLVVKHIFQGFGGNLFSGMVAFVVMGQTIALLIMYLKRVFYALLLSLVAPLIITMDTMFKSIGKQSKLFANWLKEFTLIVFMQSVHAMFLVVTLLILSEIETTLNNIAVQGIVAIMLTSGLVRFEKTFKKLFGISDTLMGDLKGGTAKLFGSAHGVTKGVNKVRDNVGKMKQAKSNKKKLTNEKALIHERLKTDGIFSGSSGGSNQGTIGPENYRAQQTNANGQGGEGTVGTKVKPRRLSDAELQTSLNNGSKLVTKGSAINTQPDVQEGRLNGRRDHNGGNDRVLAKLDEIKNTIKQTNSAKASGALNSSTQTANTQEANTPVKKRSGDKILKDQLRLAEIEEEIAQEEKNYSSGRLESIVGAGALAGGLGFGLGATDDFSEALQLGGYTTSAIDSAAGALGKHGTRKTQKIQYEESKKELTDIKNAARVKGISSAGEMVEESAGIKPKNRSVLAIQPFVKKYQKGYSEAVQIKQMIKGTYSQDSGKKMEAALTKFSKEVKDNKMSSALKAETKQIVGGLGEVRKAAKDLSDGMKTDAQKVKNQSRIRQKREK